MRAERMNITEKVNPNELRKSLDHALQYGTITELSDLFENGMNIDQEDFEGRTALQVMSANGNKEVVEMLISKRANVNAIFMYQGRIPMTALDAAQQSDKSEIVDVLLSEGAKTGRDLLP